MKSTILSITIFALLIINLDARVLTKQSGLKSSKSQSSQNSSNSSHSIVTRNQVNNVVHQKIKSMMSRDEDIDSPNHKSVASRTSKKIMKSEHNESLESSHKSIQQVQKRSVKTHEDSETSSLKTNSHATHSHATNESCNRLHESYRNKDIESTQTSHKTDTLEEIVIKKDIHVLSQKSSDVEEISQKSIVEVKDVPKSRDKGVKLTSCVIGFLTLVTML